MAFQILRTTDEILSSPTGSESPPQSRLRVTVAPDCAVGTMMLGGGGTGSGGVDIVLLGADRISPEGDVVNKMGSLGVVCAARQLKPDIRIIVVSEAEKIAPTPTPTTTTTTTTSISTSPPKEGNAQHTTHVHKEQHPPTDLSTAWSESAQAQLERRIHLQEEESPSPSSSGDGMGNHNYTNLRVFNEWFERVPARFVDAYVSELGILNSEMVRGVSGRVGELEARVFGGVGM